MAIQSQLVMRTGPNPGKSFALNKPEIYIGRDISNDIVINDAEVSRKHVRLISQGDQYVVEDLGSTNGTFINDQRIAGPHLLSTGEILQMGENVTMAYEATRHDPDSTAVMTPREAAGFGAAPPAEPAAAPPAPPPPMPEPVPVARTAAEAPEPPAPMPPEPSAAFAGTPEEYSAPPLDVDPPNKSNRKMILGGCGCLVILACIAVFAALYYIDANNLWCAWLGIC